MTTLLSLIGEQPMPILLPARHLQVERSILAYTQQVKPVAERLQRMIPNSELLPVDAYNRDFRTRLAAGRLVAIDNQVDVATGTVRLKAEFPNEDDTLFPNQFVNARLLVDTIRDAVVVPRSAVQTGPQSIFVYVVQPDSTVALRPVTTAATQDELVAIETGVEPGDLVVTDGIDKIIDKAKVAVRGAAPGQPAVAARP